MAISFDTESTYTVTSGSYNTKNKKKTPHIARNTYDLTAGKELLASDETAQRRQELMANANAIKEQQQQKKVRKDLSTLNSKYGKANKYAQANQTLNAIARQYGGKLSDAEATNTTLSFIGGTAMDIGMKVGGWGWLLAAAGGLTSLISNGVYGSKKKTYSNYVDNAYAAADNLLKYGQSLSARDEILASAYNNVLGIRQDIRTSYGEGFERLMYNYFLVKNGVTNDTYSILNGNFRTFSENIGNGGISEEAGLFDALTEGDSDYFSTAYKAFSTDDIAFMSSELSRELYGANTAFGMQLRGYETQVQQLLDNSLLEQSNAIMDASGNLLSNNLQWRMGNISSREEVGSAQASVASSGLRGGTTSNSEALARLQGAISNIQRAAQTSIVMRSLQYSMRQSQSQLASSVFSSRLNQRIMVKQVQEQTTNTLGSLAMETNVSVMGANKNLEAAGIYKSAAESNLNELPDSAIDQLYESLSL